MYPLRAIRASLAPLPLLVSLCACRQEVDVPAAPAVGAARAAEKAPDAPDDTSRPSGPLPAGFAEVLRGVDVDPGTVQSMTGRGATQAFRFRIPGARAVAVWKSLRAAIDRTRHWPVILGSTATGADVPDDARTPAEVLARARELDVGAWLEKKRVSDPEAYVAESGEWPGKVEPNETFLVTLDVLTMKPLPQVWIALVPTANGWEVPAYLAFGDWNECPPDEVHIATLRKWHEDWAAELVSLSADTMELLVAKRPAARKAALALAQSQYIYCADVVDQGVETISALAADRMASPVWYFWWD